MLYQLKLRQENRNWARYFKQEGPYNRDWALTGVTLHQASSHKLKSYQLGTLLGHKPAWVVGQVPGWGHVRGN